MAEGMPEKGPLCWSRNQVSRADERELAELTEVKEKQAYVKDMEARRKEFFGKLKNCKWLGGKKPSSMPDFYMLWNPSYDEPERLTEALQFMHKLQPRLKRELGIFLAIGLKKPKEEKKILSAMASANVVLPVFHASQDSNISSYYFSHSSKYKSVTPLETIILVYPGIEHNYDIFTFPFSELDDSEAEDMYMSAIENKLKEYAELGESTFGKSFIPRFMPTYMRSHSNEK